MPDPWEGVAADGSIVTGARRCRVPAAFEPVLADAAASLGVSGASARGFNGDIARHYRRWRQRPESRTEAADLPGVRVARKTLLAVTGLVSVQDRTWTTDRSLAARRWSELEPGLAAPLSRMLSWVKTEVRPSQNDVQRALGDEGIVAEVVDQFRSLIGLWADDPEDAY
jgi:hypothetical protein